MPRRTAGQWSLAVGLVAGVPLAAAAQTVSIDHPGVGCIVTGKFPAIEARLEPAAQVARARVHFRAHGTPHWYFVEMARSGEAFLATLPRPKKETRQIDYYVEVLDSAFSVSRTAEYTPSVVEGAGACRPGLVLAAASSAGRVLLGVPAGAPAVPAGFATTGLTTIAGAAGAATAAAGGGAAAAGGGLPTAVIVGGVVAAAAGATAVVASAAKEGDEGGPVTLEGMVTRQPTGGPGSTGTPIAGAVIGTSLDSATTTSDASGRFRLVTSTTDSRYCCEPYTVRVTAAGCRAFNEAAVWGEQPRGLTLTMSCP